MVAVIVPALALAIVTFAVDCKSEALSALPVRFPVKVAAVIPLSVTDPSLVKSIFVGILSFGISGNSVPAIDSDPSAPVVRSETFNDPDKLVAETVVFVPSAVIISVSPNLYEPAEIEPVAVTDPSEPVKDIPLVSVPDGS